MTTKRKPEDVVLDEEAVMAAAVAAFDGTRGGSRYGVRAAVRTYIAEADLIPRPQTVGEWAALVPWDKIESYGITVCFPGRTAGKEDPVFLNIPRPKPPRMTDEEIDKAAKLKTLEMCNKTEDGRVVDAIDYYLAERAKLEKERGE